MTPAWEEGLRNSAVFLCIVTKDYLRNPECWEQVALARQLQKPCIAVIKQGAPVPAGFLDGFANLRTFTFRTMADLKRIAKQINADFGPMNPVDGGV